MIYIKHKSISFRAIDMAGSHDIQNIQLDNDVLVKKLKSIMPDGPESACLLVSIEAGKLLLDHAHAPCRIFGEDDDPIVEDEQMYRAEFPDAKHLYLEEGEVVAAGCLLSFLEKEVSPGSVLAIDAEEHSYNMIKDCDGKLWIIDADSHVFVPVACKGDMGPFLFKDPDDLSADPKPVNYLEINNELRIFRLGDLDRFWNFKKIDLSKNKKEPASEAGSALVFSDNVAESPGRSSPTSVADDGLAGK